MSVADLGNGVIRINFIQPGIKDITGIEACGGRTGDLNHVIKNISVTIGAEWRRGICIGINGGPKGVNAFDYRAIRLVDLEDGPAFPRIIEEAVGQGCVIYGLPEVIQGTGGKPVSIKGPYLYEIAALPGVLVLVPALGTVSVGAIGAVLGLDKHVIAIYQRDLVVNIQTV